jgi:WD40 repeat protein
MPQQLLLASLSPTSTTQNSSNQPHHTIQETLCIYDAQFGHKLSSHRLDSTTTAGLAAHSTKGIITTRAHKSTTCVFAFGRELPTSKFAAPEPCGPVSYSHDGIHVVAGGGSGSVYVWEASSGLLLVAFKGHYRQVLAVKFSDDDSILITSADDAMVHVWDFAGLIMNDSNPEQSLLRTVSTNKTGVTGIACGSGVGVNSKVATSSLDHSCRVFMAYSGVEIFCATFPAALLCVCLDKDESLVMTGSTDGSIHIGEVENGKLSTLSGHESAVNCLQTLVSTTTSWLISGSDDGTLRWWDIESRSPLKTIRTEGSVPIREILLLDVDYLTVTKFSKGKVQVPLKKLKETEQTDRWIPAMSQTSWERRERLDQLILNSTEKSEEIKVSPSKKQKEQVEEEETAKSTYEPAWPVIANRLYSLAAENMINRMTSRTGN